MASYESLRMSDFASHSDYPTHIHVPQGDEHNTTAITPKYEPRAPPPAASADGQPPTAAELALDPSSFPDGGTRAWLSVFGCWCVWFITFGWVQSVGVFQTSYELRQLRNHTHDEIAWITSLTAFWLFAGGLWTGPVGDKYGPHTLIIGGTFIHSFGLFMASLATRYYQFLLAQGFCSAIGTAMLLYPSLGCAVSWFHKKRSFAMGIAASGSAVGGVIFPLVVHEMLPRYGFPWTMRTCAFLVLFLGATASLTVSSRLPPTPKGSPAAAIKAAFKDVPWVLTTVISVFSFLGQYLVFTFIATTAITRNVEESWSFYLIPIMSAASVFGRLGPPYLADSFGALTVCMVMIIYTFLVVACVWIPVSGKAGSIVFALLFGFGSGGILGLSPSVLAKLSDPRQIGLRTGLSYAFIGVICLFGSPAGGAIIDGAGGIRGMQGLAAAGLGAASAFSGYLLYYMEGLTRNKWI